MTAIPTRQSITGTITSAPRCSTTADGALRFFARIKVRTRQPHTDGSLGPWTDSFHNLVAYGTTAYRARSRIREGDAIVAAGRIRTYTHQQHGHPVVDVEFVAESFGHDAVRTRYRIVRTGPEQRPARRTTRRGAAADGATAIGLGRPR